MRAPQPASHACTIHQPPPHRQARTTSVHRVALIAAVARNGIIGAGNRLPWHLPEDLSRFRTLTSGSHGDHGTQDLGVDRQTATQPAEHRRQPRQLGLRLDGASVAHSIDEALAMAVRPDPVFVIGGEALYRSALPLAVLLYLTEIERDFHGDARFPTFERAEWREIAREARQPASGEDSRTISPRTSARSIERASLIRAPEIEPDPGDSHVRRSFSRPWSA